MGFKKSHGQVSMYLSRVLGIIAAVLLFVATRRNPYAYYVFLRYAVCGISIYTLWYSWKKKKYVLVWVFAVVAILFNPLFPIYLNRPTWTLIDIAVAVLFLSSIFVAKIPSIGTTSAAAITEKPTEERDKDAEHADRNGRATDLWEKARSRTELEFIRSDIIAKLSRLDLTDWEHYALKAILTHSPQLSKLTVDGELDFDMIRTSEQQGIDAAITAIRHVILDDVVSLRGLFHKMFDNVYKETSYAKGNKFYWYGRDRIIQLLRSYRTESQSFEHSQTMFYDVNGEELKLDKKIDSATIQRVQRALDHLAKRENEQEELVRLRDQYKFEIQSEFPIVEFSLENVERAGNFRYSGSLVNCLFIELSRLLYIATDYSYLGSYGRSRPLYDYEATSYASEDGVVMLAKYKGVVDYFPDRLYAELQNLDQQSWIFRWLYSHKLHLEGND